MMEENATGNLNALCRRLKLNYLDQQLETVLEAAKAGRYSAAETLEFALPSKSAIGKPAASISA